MFRCTELPDDLLLERNVSLDAELERCQNRSELEMTDKHRAMMQFRRKLPSYQMQQVNLLNSNDFSPYVTTLFKIKHHVYYIHQ